jgi:hypothetical protein
MNTELQKYCAENNFHFLNYYNDYTDITPTEKKNEKESLFSVM